MSLHQQAEWKGKKEEFEKKQANLKDELLAEERKLRGLHQQIGQSHSEWQRLDELRRACENSPELSIDKAMSRLEEIQSNYYRHKNELEQLQKDGEARRKEFSKLKHQGLPSYPPEVYEMRETLKEVQISHLLFAECIEIIEPDWQVAIEAFLARDRFSIYVPPEKFLQAKKLGERKRYSFYISPYSSARLPQVREKSILSYLKILDNNITERLIPLNEVILVKSVEEGHKYNEFITITASGYRQDRRGGIFIASNIKFYCGGLAVERQLKESEEEIVSIAKEIEKLQQLVQAVNRQMREAENEIVLLKKKEEYWKEVSNS
jgi:chromosome segregation ATPase